LFVRTIIPDAVSDGLIFVVPRPKPLKHVFTEAMSIYNNGGVRVSLQICQGLPLTLKKSLVWSGHTLNVVGHHPRGFHRCIYLGSPHLCAVIYRERQRGRQYITSHALIMDNSYQKIGAISPSVYAIEQPALGFHESKLLDNSNSILLISYITISRPTVLPHCPRSTVEFITTGRFLETSTDGSNRTLFQWDALDYVEISETVVCPGDQKAGTGRSIRDGFDFL
jgi:hypothetical protein